MGQVKRYVEAECEGDWTVLDPDDLELFKIVSVSGSFGCDVAMRIEIIIPELEGWIKKFILPNFCGTQWETEVDNPLKINIFHRWVQ